MIEIMTTKQQARQDFFRLNYFSHLHITKVGDLSLPHLRWAFKHFRIYLDEQSFDILNFKRVSDSLFISLFRKILTVTHK